MFARSSAYFVLCLVVLYLSATSATPADSADLTRIVGGNANIIKNFPYLMQVWRGSTFICGGSLVSVRFVVSAAHCYVRTSPMQLTIVGGATRLSETGVRRKVSKIIRKDAFSLKTMDQDIAVLKLAKDMTGPNISPIRLNNQKITPGMIMQVTGWGIVSENGLNPPNILRTIKVPVVPKAQCKVQYQSVLTLTNSMFCASKPRTDACSGDSGGPAVCNGRLCGIVSWGNGCARRNYPGVYTGVYSMLSMIHDAMKQ